MSETQAGAGVADDGGKPWGFWSTVGFGVLIVALWIVGQTIVSLTLAGVGAKGSALTQGWIVARATIISAPITVGGSVLLARVRKGISVAAYLGLTWPSARQALRWSLIILGFIAASDALTVALGRSVVDESMIPVFQTARSLPIFLLALVVAAPLAEEFLFRGFLLTGLLNSRLGPSGAISLTALAWGALHLQYDLYGMATVVAIGILLGLVRWRTGSLWLCVLLHGLMNAIATVEAMLTVSMG